MCVNNSLQFWFAENRKKFKIQGLVLNPLIWVHIQTF